MEADNLPAVGCTNLLSGGGLPPNDLPLLTMPHICQLSPAVVNKIAAGEVIERPASVLKELLENSVDAGAGRIDASLEKGGSEVIRVRDDGCGIDADQLTLAVASHATSKIKSAEDLFSVGTLGFRGEALASIAAVSRLTIRSCTRNASTGTELEVVGGELQPVVPVGCPHGTTIEVRNLFYNTPVRQKFLRSTQTEVGHATEAFTRIALAYPQVHLTLTNNGRLVHDLPADDFRGRITKFFGEEIARGLIEVESENEGVRLDGYVVNPQQSRANNRTQYLFLNGRTIRDRALQHALTEAYRGLLLNGRYSICFLRLEMPSEVVDVNVHPTKQEVRFQDAGRLYSQLLGTLRSKFLTTDLTAQAEIQEDPSKAACDQTSGPSQLVAWARNELGVQTESKFASPAAEPQNAAQPAGTPLSLHRLDGLQSLGGGVAGSPGVDPVAGNPDEGVSLPVGKPSALQIHNRYLVVETDDGMEIIDQHALHERILYERIRIKVETAPLESQKLLVPEPVDLTASEAARILEHRDLLQRLGLDVQPFGGETVLVASYPAMLAKISPSEVLRDLVECLEVAGSHPEPTTLLDDLLHSIACKAAVKFGDPLVLAEIDALLADRHLIRDSHHCPHGRPTTLMFTRQQLDRQFKRI
jgi:DNA mismatch repair protein MutL